jgi:hypothetical protein
VINSREKIKTVITVLISRAGNRETPDATGVQIKHPWNKKPSLITLIQNFFGKLNLERNQSYTACSLKMFARNQAAGN